MPRIKHKTLTEQMYYILLCLKEELSGSEILDKVPRLTKGRVKVGTGTLYNLLEEFCEADLIRKTKVEGRKISYILTDNGKRKLEEEYIRLFNQAVDFQIAFGGTN